MLSYRHNLSNRAVLVVVYMNVAILFHRAWRAYRPPVEAHPYMLCHTCGFALADQGADTRLLQNYLGHQNIQHTVLHFKNAKFEGGRVGGVGRVHG